MTKLETLKAAGPSGVQGANAQIHPIGLSMWNSDGTYRKKWNVKCDGRKQNTVDQNRDPNAWSNSNGPDKEQLVAARARDADHGVCVQSGPWTYLDLVKDAKYYDQIVPGIHAQQHQQNVRFSRVSPHAIASLLDGWETWVRANEEHPDSFLCYLTNEICQAMRDRNL